MCLLIGLFFGIGLQAFEPFAGVAQSRFKLGFLYETLFIGIDEPGNATFYLLDQFVQGGTRSRTGSPVFSLQPTAVFLLDLLRVGQHREYILPNGGFEQIAPYLFVGANLVAPEPGTFGTAASVVAVRAPCTVPTVAHRLAVAGIPAPLTDQQALEEMSRALHTLTLTLPILLELFGHGRK